MLSYVELAAPASCRPCRLSEIFQEDWTRGRSNHLALLTEQNICCDWHVAILSLSKRKWRAVCMTQAHEARTTYSCPNMHVSILLDNITFLRWQPAFQKPLLQPTKVYDVYRLPPSGNCEEICKINMFVLDHGPQALPKGCTRLKRTFQVARNTEDEENAGEFGMFK